MKLHHVIDVPGHREIEMVAQSGTSHRFPHDQMTPPPSNEDPIRKIFVDPELASEGVTYFLASGAEGPCCSTTCTPCSRSGRGSARASTKWVTDPALRFVGDGTASSRRLPETHDGFGLHWSRHASREQHAGHD